MKKISTFIIITGLFLPLAAQIFNEDFNAPLGPEWTAVDSGGAVNAVVGGGVLTLGPLDSSTLTGGETAYIQQSYDNSGTNFIGYTGSFKADFTGMSFTPDGTTGNNVVTLFRLMPTSGNARLAELRFEMREWNNDYAFVSNNGVQFSSGGAVGSTQSVSTGTLEALDNVQFDFDINFQNNGGLNWTVSSDWVITDLDTSSVIGTLNSTITRDSNNGAFDPITGSNALFQFGTAGTTEQFTAPNVTGNVLLDDFIASGIVAPIPEPSTLLLALTGFVGLWMVRRKK